MNFFEVCFNSMVILYVLLSLAVIWVLYRTSKRSIECFRLRQGRMWYQNLSGEEANAISQLLTCHAMTGEQVRERFPRVDFTKIHNVTPFLQLVPPPADIWTLNEDWRDVLVKVAFLSEGIK